MFEKDLGDHFKITFHDFWHIGKVAPCYRMLKKVWEIFVVHNEILECSSTDDVHAVASRIEDCVYPREHSSNVELKICSAFRGNADLATTEGSHCTKSSSPEIPLLNFHSGSHSSSLTKCLLVNHRLPHAV